jgi:TRAP-type C4-dicarboxylate transport system substrate-binding protein
MPFTETYTALEQGAIDGMTNPLLNILDGKYEEVSKYLTITNHMYTPQAVVVSKKFWDKLTPAEQKLMREAAQETAVYQRKIARDEATKVLAEVKKKGMTVFELNADEIAKLRERSKPVVEKYTKELGPIVDEMYAAVDKVRKSK